MEEERNAKRVCGLRSQTDSNSVQSQGPCASSSADVAVVDSTFSLNSTYKVPPSSEPHKLPY